MTDELKKEQRRIRPKVQTIVNTKLPNKSDGGATQDNSVILNDNSDAVEETRQRMEVG
jgi:hypothetical protein